MLQALIILILSIFLSGLSGYMYAQKTNCGKPKMLNMNMNMKKKNKKEKMKPNTVKGEANAKGEPAEVQSMVAQYMIENGL